MTYAGLDTAGQFNIGDIDIQMDIGDTTIPPSTNDVAVQASDMAVAAQPTVESTLALPSAGDIQENSGDQDATDVRATTAAPDQPTITVPTD